MDVDKGHEFSAGVRHLLAVDVLLLTFPVRLSHRSHQLGLLSFQTLANQLSVGEVSGQHPPERDQNDQRAPQRAPGQPLTLLPQRPHLGPRVLPELHQARDVAQADVWPLLLPRHRAGEEELRAPG